MKQIMISLSALKPSQYRKYVKGWNKGRYAEAFKEFAGEDAYRVYIPLNRVSTESIAAPHSINKAVESLGYKVEDYRAGIAVDTSGKRKIRIGRLLGKHPELQKQFNEDKDRAAYKGKHLICISRHPYDIAGMSTGRGWTSCMNIDGGSNKEYVAAEIDIGTIVAYVIEEKDRDLKRPVSRIAIKPFYKEGAVKKGKPVLVAEPTVYGTKNIEGFTSTVQRWLDKYINKGMRKGTYIINEDSYDDNTYRYEHFGNMSDSEVAKTLDYSSDGKTALSAREKRMQVLLTRPEALLSMKAPCTTDLFTVAHHSPQILIKYLESGGKSYINEASFKSMRLADKEDIRLALINAVMKDHSLFDRALKLSGGFTSRDYRMLISDNPVQSFKYIPENLITDEIISDVFKDTTIISRLKSLVAVLPKGIKDRLPSKKKMIEKYPKWYFTLDNPTKEDLLLALHANRSMLHSLVDLPATYEIAETVFEFLHSIKANPDNFTEYALNVSNRAVDIPYSKVQLIILRALAEIKHCDFWHYGANDNVIKLICKLTPDNLTAEIMRKNELGENVYRHILDCTGFSRLPSVDSELSLRSVDFHNILGSDELIEENFFSILEYWRGFGIQLMREAPEILESIVDLFCAKLVKGYNMSGKVFNEKGFWDDLYNYNRKLGYKIIPKLIAAGDFLTKEMRTYHLFSKLPDYFRLFMYTPWAYAWYQMCNDDELMTPEIREYVMSIDAKDYPEHEDAIAKVQRGIKLLAARKGMTEIDIPF